MLSIKLNSQVLLTALKQAAGLILPNPVVPILDNVLLTAAAGQLTLTSSNLAADLTVRVEALELPMQDFAICLPAKLLQTTLSNLPNLPIALEIDLDTYAATLRAGKGRYRLAGENAIDFPRPDTTAATTRFTFAGPALATALSAALPFILNDFNRPELAAVLLDVRRADALGSELRTVGCDGHRISWHTFRALDEAAAQPARYLLPQPVAKQLATLAVRSTQIIVQLGSWLQADAENGEWSLRGRLLEERYPEYENVIPTHNPNTLLVERGALTQALRRVVGFAPEKSVQVGLDLAADTAVRVWAEDIAAAHEAEDEAAGEYQGEVMQIGFNGKLLDTCLQVLPDGPLHMEFSTPNRGALLRAATPAPDAGHTQVLLMPVMLNNSLAA